MNAGFRLSSSHKGRTFSTTADRYYEIDDLCTGVDWLVKIVQDQGAKLQELEGCDNERVVDFSTKLANLDKIFNLAWKSYEVARSATYEK